ncbi:MAG: hypothetical protein UY09_C0015G0002 [Parcubacteria group bacterium GW2011_GWA2_47_8]|nr:MAG: hypothetical protein UY09_C0015G0002 [Parcubacteria group bacterium GW2011_GWA2_47_8]OHB18464.1 MAG: hypothetical protein A2666_05265 [Parcubacteria group bacterium RIFCSPHIGHO2_01_FULL_47_10b]
MKHHIAQRAYIFSTSVGLAVLFAFLVIIPNHFPYLGLSLWFVMALTAVYVFKDHADHDRYATSLYVFSLIVAACIAIRAAPDITAFNIFAVLYLGTLLALHKKERQFFGLIEVLFAPLLIGLQSLITKNLYPFDAKTVFSKHKTQFNKQFRDTVIGLIVAAALLLIVVPLLGSANPIFASWIEKLHAVFNWDFLHINYFGMHVARIIMIIVLSLFIPRFLSRTHAPFDKTRGLIEQRWNVSLAIPKVALIVVMVAFFVSQAQLYMASGEALAALGYSHSQLAREVFGQLSFITLLVMLLVYFDKQSTKFARVTTYVLLALGFILSLVALKSVLDYVVAWGLTDKRLYGFTTLGWLYGIYILFLHMYVKRHDRTSFVRQTVVWTSIILVCMNVINFDYLIYHTNQVRDPQGVDHYYLAGLSADSRSYGEHIALLKEMGVDKTPDSERYYAIYPSINGRNWQAGDVLRYKIEHLQAKYGSLDIRSFNLNEFLTYRQVQGIVFEDGRW